MGRKQKGRGLPPPQSKCVGVQNFEPLLWKYGKRPNNARLLPTPYGLHAATSFSSNLIVGTAIFGAFEILSESSINFAIHNPTSAFTILSPHRGHTPAGTPSTTISLPLIQKSCFIRLAFIEVLHISHSPYSYFFSFNPPTKRML